MEQERFRRIRNRPDTGFTQDAAGHVRSVDEEEGISRRQAAKLETTDEKELSAEFSVEYSDGASLTALSGSI